MNNAYVESRRLICNEATGRRKSNAVYCCAVNTESSNCWVGRVISRVQQQGTSLRCLFLRLMTRTRKNSTNFWHVRV